MEREGYTYLPNMETNRCFGCGPANPCGLRMEFYTDGKSIASWLSIPNHMTGWSNLVHGGILSTVLDEMMGRSVIHLLKKLTMTKSMTVEFIKPVYAGMEIKAEGRVIEKNEREAVAEGIIYNMDGEVCTKASGRLGLFSMEFMKEKGVITRTFARWFDELK